MNSNEFISQAVIFGGSRNCGLLNFSNPPHYVFDHGFKRMGREDVASQDMLIFAFTVVDPEKFLGCASKGFECLQGQGGINHLVFFAVKNQHGLFELR